MRERLEPDARLRGSDFTGRRLPELASGAPPSIACSTTEPRRLFSFSPSSFSEDVDVKYFSRKKITIGGGGTEGLFPMGICVWVAMAFYECSAQGIGIEVSVKPNAM